MSGEEACEYGLIDRVVSQHDVAGKPNGGSAPTSIGGDKA